jgi:phage terminase Nu1 subunit (DNA packaging protein)
MSKANKGLVTRTELSEILGCSPNRVSELKQLGIIHAVGNRYDATKCVELYLAYKRDRSTDLRNSSDRDDLLAKLRKHRSVLLKDKNRLERIEEECGRVEDLELVYTAVRQMVLAELATLPDRIADAVVGLKELAYVADAIDKVVYASLTKMAKGVSEV